MEHCDHEVVEALVDLDAVLVAPKIVVVLARVAENVHHRVVVAHEVVSHVH